MLRFILWMHNQFCAENILFWLETQNFKFITNDEDILSEVNRIYEKYFVSNCLNLDEPIIVEELKHRLKLPDRTLFMATQNAIWALLKYECFPKFKVDTGKALTAKLSVKQIKQIQKVQPESVDLYEQFLDLTYKNTDQISEFKPTQLPNDEYNEHLHQNLPTMMEIWLDRDLMLAFREYLYQQLANDSLSFYLDLVYFENYTDEEDVPIKAEELYAKYIGPDAISPVNLDFSVVSKIEKTLKKQPSITMFHTARDSVLSSLENQWFPEFLQSPLYKACNDETIEFVETTGTRDRGNTMTNYDAYASLIRKDNINPVKGKRRKKEKIGSEKSERKRKRKKGSEMSEEVNIS